jgi:MFS family permease
MYFTFGVLNGFASSMLYFSSFVVLIEYFHKHLSLANGISVSGAGIGTLVINMLSQHIISRYGLTMAFRVVAGFSAITFVAALAYSPISRPSESGPSHLHKERIVPAESSKTFLSKCKSVCKPGEQWQNKGFIVWTVAMALILFAYYIPCMYLVSYFHTKYQNTHAQMCAGCPADTCMTSQLLLPECSFSAQPIQIGCWLDRAFNWMQMAAHRCLLVCITICITTNIYY